MAIQKAYGCRMHAVLMKVMGAPFDRPPSSSRHLSRRWNWHDAQCNSRVGGFT